MQNSMVNSLRAAWNGNNKLAKEAADYIERMTDDFERECSDIDTLLKNGIGWTADRTRTECGSLKVVELSEAMRSMMAPGTGG